jgi:hypothetical protein
MSAAKFSNDERETGEGVDEPKSVINEANQCDLVPNSGLSRATPKETNPQRPLPKPQDHKWSCMLVSLSLSYYMTMSWKGFPKRATLLLTVFLLAKRLLRGLACGFADEAKWGTTGEPPASQATRLKLALLSRGLSTTDLRF